MNASTRPPIERPEPLSSALMFGASLLWLLAAAGSLHLHESGEDARVFLGCITLAATLWPLFLFEAAWRIGQRAANRHAAMWCVLMPGLRLGLRDPQTAEQLWLPGLGWKTVDEALRQRIARDLNLPMLFVSLTVLPLILAEYVWFERIAASPTLSRITAIGTALVWWSFTIEFILMCSIAEKKLSYVREHWLDLAIILLPLLAFLRALQLGRLLRLQQLTKTARVYRLRGVAMRTYRAALLVDAIARIIQGSPERRLARLQLRIEEQERQLRDMRDQAAALQAQLSTETTSLAAESNAA